MASAINLKCKCYASWYPDPACWVVDAFTFSWSKLNFYTFPPFILIPKVLRKIIDEGAKGILIVPWWPSQPWFPLFNSLLIQKPLITSPSYDLLISLTRNHHPSWKTLSLEVWEIMRVSLKIKGVPDSALNTCLASLTESTIKQYRKPLEQWWYYCNENNFSLFNPTANNFLKFLAKEFIYMNSYSSLNTTRAALSFISLNDIDLKL